MKTKNIRLIYLRSRYNQVFLNGIALKNSSSDYSEYLGIHKKYIVFKKHNFLYKIYAYIVALLFPFILFTKVIKALGSIISSKRKRLECDNFFLATSIALPRISKEAGVYDDSSIWIELPWCYTKEINDSQRVTIFELLSISDVFFCLKESLVLFYFVLLRDGIKLALYNLRSFEWYLYFLGVNKIPKHKSVFFCSQADVWSTLLDSLDSYKKKLLQHGTEIVYFNTKNEDYLRYDKENGFWTLKFPIRYSCVDEVYTFSEKDYKALCNCIIDNKPRYVIVGHRLNIVSLDNHEKKSVLIIGFSRNYLAKEKQLLEALKDKDVNVYLKNHPTCSPTVYENLKDSYNFHLINTSLYPFVDIVFSYESTLAQAYEDNGIKVIYYETMNFANLNVDDYLNL